MAITLSTSFSVEGLEKRMGGIEVMRKNLKKFVGSLYASLNCNEIFIE